MTEFTDAVRDDTSLRDLLFRLCDVDTAGGILVWKRRPVEMFADQRACDSWNTRFAGNEAGSTNKRGYREIQIAGRLHLRHRLIWLAVNGVLPVEADHIHGVGAGASLRQSGCDLREARAARQTRAYPAHSPAKCCRSRRTSASTCALAASAGMPSSFM